MLAIEFLVRAKRIKSVISQLNELMFMSANIAKGNKLTNYLMYQTMLR